jgi:dolichol-phosphate mannosyltransferase
MTTPGAAPHRPPKNDLIGAANGLPSGQDGRARPSRGFDLLTRLAPETSAASWERYVPLLVGASVLLRFLAQARVPLIPEEAYYWMYSRHPAPSYFDHPPMVAWTIGLGTCLFGNTEFGVRIVSSLMMCASSLLAYQLGRAWFGRFEGLVAAVLLQALPLYFAMGFLGTMDGPLVFFWLACMVGVTRALLRDDPTGWYVAGVACGGAMLSKYTGVFLGVGALLAVVAHRPWRAHLRRPHPYAAAAIAAALFNPVLVWNAEHDWASFQFQLADRFAGTSFGWRFVGRFLFYQLLVLTPVFLVAAVGALWRARRLLMRPRWLLPCCFSLPLLAAMAARSPRYEVHINWTLPAFLALLPVAGRAMRIESRRRATPPAGHGTRIGTATIAACALFNAGMAAYLITTVNRASGIPGFGRWREVAVQVERYEDQLERETGREPLVICAGAYRLASVVAFYRSPMERDVPASDYTTSEWILRGHGLGFEYWIDPAAWIGKDCIFVEATDGPADTADLERRLKRRFASVEVIGNGGIATGGDRHAIAVCRGFRGPPVAPPATARDAR